jgi:hypothetical protein
VTDEQLRAVAERCGWAARTTAREAGVHYNGHFLARLKRMRVEAAATSQVLTVPSPPDSSVPIDELVERRKREFEHKREHMDARKLIPVIVKSSLPIGILHFGDPHLDDDGTDLGLVEDHAKLVRDTPGLYGATPGDTTNNWIGRLARLYAQQGTTACDGWRLAEWFIHEVRDWLYLVGGNHDLWSGSGDPLHWIAARAGALYQPSEVRIALRFPNKAEVRINCRHDFAGRSQWNPAHGPMKALFLGVRDHIAIAGHTHESAYGLLKDPQSGITMHGLRVASYKTYDRYALDHGFRDQTLSPCALTVIDPRLPPTHPGIVQVFWDPFQGAEYLGWLRKRQAA